MRITIRPGFHTQSRCINLLDTVDRFVECRIDRERFAVNRGRTDRPRQAVPDQHRDGRRGCIPPGNGTIGVKGKPVQRVGVTAEYLGVGVDRCDERHPVSREEKGAESVAGLSDSA